MATPSILSRGLIFAALMAFALPAWAQGVGGIGGTVMDSSGAVLPGVTSHSDERAGRHPGRQPGGRE